jgi:hypothetical protein
MLGTRKFVCGCATLMKWGVQAFTATATAAATAAGAAAVQPTLGRAAQARHCAGASCGSVRAVAVGSSFSNLAPFEVRTLPGTAVSKVLPNVSEAVLC